MVDVPLDARTECVDGLCGRSVGVILDPMTSQVTHFVVEEGGLLRTERLVPYSWAVDTTPDVVRLRCSEGELAAMQPLVEIESDQMDRPAFVNGLYRGRYGWPYVFLITTKMPARHEHTPAGELIVRRRARVSADDGPVGQVDEFLVDPTTRRITHLVLREGHLWSQRDVMVPVAEIERVAQDTVYLRLDKDAVESLPAMSMERWHGRKAA